MKKIKLWQRIIAGILVCTFISATIISSAPLNRDTLRRSAVQGRGEIVRDAEGNVKYFGVRKPIIFSSTDKVFQKDSGILAFFLSRIIRRFPVFSAFIVSFLLVSPLFAVDSIKEWYSGITYIQQEKADLAYIRAKLGKLNPIGSKEENTAIINDLKKYVNEELLKKIIVSDRTYDVSHGAVMALYEIYLSKKRDAKRDEGLNDVKVFQNRKGSSIFLFSIVHGTKEHFEEIIPELDKVFAGAKKASKPVMVMLENSPTGLIWHDATLLKLSRYWDSANQRFIDERHADLFLYWIVSQNLKLNDDRTQKINSILDAERKIVDTSQNSFYERTFHYLWDKKRDGYNFQFLLESPGFDTYFKLLDERVNVNVLLELGVKELDPQIGMERYRFSVSARMILFRDKDVTKQIDRLLKVSSDRVVVIIRGCMHKTFLLDELRNKGYEPVSFISPSAAMAIEELLDERDVLIKVPIISEISAAKNRGEKEKMNGQTIKIFKEPVQKMLGEDVSLSFSRDSSAVSNSI